MTWMGAGGTGHVRFDVGHGRKHAFDDVFQDISNRARCLDDALLVRLSPWIVGTSLTFVSQSYDFLVTNYLNPLALENGVW